MPALTPGPERAQVFAALEQTLLGALKLSERNYFVPLPFEEAADAVTRCHTTDWAAFSVIVAADAESRDYHEKIRDASSACVTNALSNLRSAVHQGGSARPSGSIMRHGGRIEVQRKESVSQSGCARTWAISERMQRPVPDALGPQLDEATLGVPWHNPRPRPLRAAGIHFMPRTRVSVRVRGRTTSGEHRHEYREDGSSMDRRHTRQAMIARAASRE